MWIIVICQQYWQNATGFCFLKKKERKKERNDVTVFVSYSSGCHCKNPWMRPQSRYCRVVHFTSCISHSSYCGRTNPASVPLIVSLWFTRWGKFASKPPKSLFQLIRVTQTKQQNSFHLLYSILLFRVWDNQRNSVFTAVSSHPCPCTILDITGF